MGEGAFQTSFLPLQSRQLANVIMLKLHNGEMEFHWSILLLCMYEIFPQ